MASSNRSASRFPPRYELLGGTQESDRTVFRGLAALRKHNLKHQHETVGILSWDASVKSNDRGNRVSTSLSRWTCCSNQDGSPVPGWGACRRCLPSVVVRSELRNKPMPGRYAFSREARDTILLPLQDPPGLIPRRRFRVSLSAINLRIMRMSIYEFSITRRASPRGTIESLTATPYQDRNNLPPLEGLRSDPAGHSQPRPGRI
jgi:hypothetical protein